MLSEPLAPTEAKRLIRDILAVGGLRLSTHAVNVLRAGVVEPAEWHAGR